MESARNLLQFNFNADAFARRAPMPVPIAPEVIAGLDRIQRDQNGIIIIPEREDLRVIHHLFFNTIRTGLLSTEFDSPRRIGHLAWALIISEDGLPRIVDTEKLNDALELIEERFRMSTVNGVFEALLQAWDAPGARLLREFIRRHLATYDGRRQSLQNIRANLDYYCKENGATQLAMNLIRGQVKLSEVWSHLKLLDHMRGYRYFGIVAEEYVKHNRRLDRECVADIVKFVEMHRNDTIARSIVSRLIEALGLAAPEHLRQPVQSYARKNWGDPRVTGGDNRWRNVSEEARTIFATWTNEADLNFFFDIVAQACDDDNFEYRKTFWLAYLEHIAFCRPVLRRDVQNLIRNNPQALQFYRERNPATLRGGNRNQHAFIIRMGDHTFVEFSTEGACYVYHNARTPFHSERSEFHMSDLRDMDWREYRETHRDSENYNWQTSLARWIRSTLGIEPMRSFRLDGENSSEWIHLSCPNENCERRLRIPAGRGRFRIRCPICQRTFEYETS